MKKYLSQIGVFISILFVLAGCSLFSGNKAAETPVNTQKTATIEAKPFDGSSISIVEFTFQPQNVTIKKGDTLVWTNNDQMAHTVTSTDKSVDSGDIASGKTFSFTFTKAGKFTYNCKYHPSMQGTVTVK